MSPTRVVFGMRGWMDFPGAWDSDYYHGSSRLGSFSEAWSPWSQAQSVVGLRVGAGEPAGSVCMFGLGKLKREISASRNRTVNSSR